MLLKSTIEQTLLYTRHYNALLRSEQHSCFVCWHVVMLPRSELEYFVQPECNEQLSFQYFFAVVTAHVYWNQLKVCQRVLNR